MKLDDIKLGMKVLVVRDRVDDGWTLLPPDIADKLFVEVESANSTTYAIVPTDHVISKVEKDSSLWCDRCISNT